MSVIKSFSVENGDTFYIKHNSNNFSIIDCNLTDSRKDEILDEIASEESKKEITRFISTHPDEDHIHGLEYLDEKIKILNFYCVKNEATKTSPTSSFEKYCELRDSKAAFFLEKGKKRRWMNQDDQEKKYGSSGINILWPVVNNEEFKNALKTAQEGGSPNNISPIITYSLENGVHATWMGDLETDFMEKVKDDADVTSTDILFAPHHGRTSGKPPKEWMDSMDPKLVVIGEADSDDLDYYQKYTHICQNTAGDLLFECTTGYVHIYASNPYEVSGLANMGMGSKNNLGYIGSLKTKERD